MVVRRGKMFNLFKRKPAKYRIHNISVTGSYSVKASNGRLFINDIEYFKDSELPTGVEVTWSRV